MAVQSGPAAETLAAGRGPAVAVTVSPQAMPMRFFPKSKARMVWTASGMPGSAAHHVFVDAQEAPRGAPAIFVRQVEHHAGVDGHRHPRVLLDLALELPGLPAGIAERDECAIGAFTARDGSEHVARCGHL